MIGGSKRLIPTTLGVTLGVSDRPGAVTSIINRLGPESWDVVHSTPGSRSSTTRVVPDFGSAIRICLTNLSPTTIMCWPCSRAPSMRGSAPMTSTNIRSGFSRRSLWYSKSSLTSMAMRVELPSDQNLTARTTSPAEAGGSGGTPANPTRHRQQASAAAIRIVARLVIPNYLTVRNVRRPRAS
jgi:hypothetical protein